MEFFLKLEWVSLQFFLKNCSRDKGQLKILEKWNFIKWNLELQSEKRNVYLWILFLLQWTVFLSNILLIQYHWSRGKLNYIWFWKIWKNCNKHFCDISVFVHFTFLDAEKSMIKILLFNHDAHNNACTQEHKLTKILQF